VPDAWIASIVLRSGDRLITFDRGFGRLLDARRLILLTAVH
jgi:predicted nucleic acid-binding protein